eukprot:636716-Rhodomonas_salina.1
MMMLMTSGACRAAASDSGAGSTSDAGVGDREVGSDFVVCFTMYYSDLNQSKVQLVNEPLSSSPMLAVNSC